MKFVVSVHDISPKFRVEIQTILRAVKPLIGRAVSLAIVPNWHGQYPLNNYQSFADSIDCEELLLHGYSHVRTKGASLVSVLTGSQDEMNGLGIVECNSKLREGQEIFSCVFNRHAEGFLPPTWQLGGVNADCLISNHFKFVVGYHHLWSVRGKRIPLQTWNWDNGRCELLGYVGEVYGHLQELSGRPAVEVLTIHPRDIHSGFFNRALTKLREYLQHNYRPTVFSELIQNASDI